MGLELALARVSDLHSRALDLCLLALFGGFLAVIRKRLLGSSKRLAGGFGLCPRALFGHNPETCMAL